MSTTAPLHVFQLSTLAEFQSLRRAWNGLAAGLPMRGWDWNAAWWRHYGNPRTAAALRRPLAPRASHLPVNELYLLAVFDADVNLVAVAPWYISTAANEIRTLRFLGSGEVCTDDCSVLCRPGYEAAVAQTLARTLCDPLHMADWLPTGQVRHWDRIEWESIAADNLIMNLLLEHLESHGQIVHRTGGVNCWRLPLPNTWDAYLRQLGKSRRKNTRGLERDFLQSGRAVVRWAESAADFPQAWETLIHLHQARQQSLGHAGSFGSQPYAQFHRQLAETMLEQGKLWLGVLEIDGQPVAADYLLAGDDTLYAYQGGIDPAALASSPGRLLTIATLQRAIDRGLKQFDFLRGDEAYKASWLAEPVAMRNVWAAPSTAANRVRCGLRVASAQVKHWFKQSLKPVGNR